MVQFEKIVTQTNCRLNCKKHASLQRSQDLPLERLWKKKQTSKKAKTKYFSECARRREKGTKILTTHLTFTKTHILQQTNISYDIISMKKIVLNYKELDGMTRIRYKLTIRTQTENIQTI